MLQMLYYKLSLQGRVYFLLPLLFSPLPAVHFLPLIQNSYLQNLLLWLRTTAIREVPQDGALTFVFFWTHTEKVC